MGDRTQVELWIRRDFLAEIRAEARRLDRSASWVMERAWKIACAEVMRIPAPTSNAAPGGA